MFTAKCVPDEKDWIPAFAGMGGVLTN